MKHIKTFDEFLNEQEDDIENMSNNSLAYKINEYFETISGICSSMAGEYRDGHPLDDGSLIFSDDGYTYYFHSLSKTSKGSDLEKEIDTWLDYYVDVVYYSFESYDNEGNRDIIFSTNEDDEEETYLSEYDLEFCKDFIKYAYVNAIRHTEIGKMFSNKDFGINLYKNRRIDIKKIKTINTEDKVEKQQSERLNSFFDNTVRMSTFPVSIIDYIIKSDYSNNSLDLEEKIIRFLKNKSKVLNHKNFLLVFNKLTPENQAKYKNLVTINKFKIH